jgi:hypothetical protein
MSAYSLGDTGLNTTDTIVKILFTFAGIALYNTLELVPLIFITFKRYHGLYFWSLLLSTLGIIPFTLGLLFKFFQVIKINYISIALIVLGWQLMVTGQSVVLYSRLHLIVSNKSTMRWALGMIAANWIVSDVPTTVFVFGASSAYSEHYTEIYGIWERLQLCLYFVQESILSCLYIVNVIKLLRSGENRHIGKMNTQTRTILGSSRNWSSHSRKVFKHLVYVNIVIIFLGVTLLTLEFVGHYELQVLYKVCMPLSTKCEF